MSPIGWTRALSTSPAIASKARSSRLRPAPAITLARETKDQPDFKMVDLPRGRELSFEGSPDGVAGAIVGFQFDDTAKADQFDLPRRRNPCSARSMADDYGENRDQRHGPLGDRPGRRQQSHGPGKAMKLNAAVSGWAFKLSESKTQQILAARETLLKPPPGK